MSPTSDAAGNKLISAADAEAAFVPPCAIASVPELISDAAILFPVSVCVPARLTSVSVAAGIVTVKAEAAEAGALVILPVAVALASVRFPVVVPATPIVSVGLDQVRFAPVSETAVVLDA